MSWKKLRVLRFALAAIPPTIFLLWSLRPGCFLNFIPFAIHQAFLSGWVKEHTFIYAFDVAVALILLAICLRVTRTILK
ncbi:MAG: hypothetical protein JNM31_03965 [Flavobacteriales bacterium]|nr:hypothetical protein [Flavobacteriales bacterium]